MKITNEQKAIKSGATHRFVNGHGHTIYGRDIGKGIMQMLCDDCTTWMPIPCFVGSGMRSLTPDESEE